MKRSKSNCIPPCFRWNILVFFISGFLFCWCSNRFSFGATSFSVILQSRTADWGPLDGSLDRCPCQPQDVPGRDAVRLWGLLSQRKTKDKTVALDRSCVSGSRTCTQLTRRSSCASENYRPQRARKQTATRTGFLSERWRQHNIFQEVARDNMIF